VISTTWRRELSPSFSPARLGTKGNSRHSETNIRGTCTITCHCQKLGGQLKRGDFSTCDMPRPGRHKTVTTPEIIDKIHELILEDCWISAKSIAEKLGIYVSRLGPSFMKIWTCGSSSRSGSRNARMRIKNVNDASRLSNFWNFFFTIHMISCCDW